MKALELVKRFADTKGSRRNNFYSGRPTMA
jgi:hypothetical protein